MEARDGLLKEQLPLHRLLYFILFFPTISSYRSTDTAGSSRMNRRLGRKKNTPTCCIRESIKSSSVSCINLLSATRSIRTSSWIFPQSRTIRFLGTCCTCTATACIYSLISPATRCLPSGSATLWALNHRKTLINHLSVKILKISGIAGICLCHFGSEIMCLWDSYFGWLRKSGSKTVW